MRNHLLTALVCIATTLGPLGAVRADDDEKCNDCGVVTAVQVVEQGGGSGLGAAAGALAGGLLGNQVGKTETAATTVGGTATTLLGVAGGALGGHYAEKALRGSKEWNVAVQMDNGATRTVTLKSEPKVRAGERVRVSEGGVTPYKADHDDEKDEKDD